MPRISRLYHRGDLKGLRLFFCDSKIATTSYNAITHSLDFSLKVPFGAHRAL